MKVIGTQQIFVNKSVHHRPSGLIQGLRTGFCTVIIFRNSKISCMNQCFGSNFLQCLFFVGSIPCFTVLFFVILNRHISFSKKKIHIGLGHFFIDFTFVQTAPDTTECIDFFPFEVISDKILFAQVTSFICVRVNTSCGAWVVCGKSMIEIIFTLTAMFTAIIKAYRLLTVCIVRNSMRCKNFCLKVVAWTI